MNISNRVHYFGAVSFVALLLVVASTVLYQQNSFYAHLQGWYPTNKRELIAQLHSLDQQAANRFSAHFGDATVRALIAPHAGYIYSGDVAAAAYRVVHASSIKRVLVIAPSHQEVYDGIALPIFDSYVTPLGAIPIDLSVVKQLAQDSLCAYNTDVYMAEHACEMQLPLIQRYIPHATLVPLIVGHMTHEQLRHGAQLLAPYIDTHTLVVISSDFTHYGKRFDYTPFADMSAESISYRIMQLDSGALQAIQQYSMDAFMLYIQKTGDTICGRNAIALLLALIENQVLGPVTPQLVAYKTSAEITHQEDDSVSYVGMVFVTGADNKIEKREKTGDTACVYDRDVMGAGEKKQEINGSARRGVRSTQCIENSGALLNKDQFTAYEKRALLTLSREVLQQSFAKQIKESLLYPILTHANTVKQGAFVTLYKKGKLRGCIGRVFSEDPLYKTIIDMTRAAAFNDSRFSPVTQDELPDITIAISVLTEPHPVNSYHDIVLGRDGIILTHGNKTALFLPKVATEFQWDLPTTLSELSEKAGLPSDAWQDANTTYQVFESIDFEEQSPGE